MESSRDDGFCICLYDDNDPLLQKKRKSSEIPIWIELCARGKLPAKSTQLPIALLN